jgi:hypothetical protein
LRKNIIIFEKGVTKEERYIQNVKFFAFLRRRIKVTHKGYAEFLCQHTSKIHDFNLNIFVACQVEGLFLNKHKLLLFCDKQFCHICEKASKFNFCTLKVYDIDGNCEP